MSEASYQDDLNRATSAGHELKSYAAQQGLTYQGPYGAAGQEHLMGRQAGLFSDQGGNQGYMEANLNNDGFSKFDKNFVLGESLRSHYDTGGKFSHNSLMQDYNHTGNLVMALAAAAGMGFGLPAMGFGGGGGGGMMAGMAGDAFLPGALGVDGISMGAIPGLESFAAGGGLALGDAYLPGALSGDAYLPGALNVGGNMPTGLAGLESYAAAPGVAGAGGGSNPSFLKSVQSTMDTPLGKLGTTAASSMLGGGQKQGGMSNADLASIVSGVMDYRGQKGASDDMLSYMREQQAKIDSLYAPGSPEWNSLWQAMERKDAAAGRNSQYGTRAVDFLGKVADTKAKYTADLTKGLAGNYAAAFNQNAAAPAGMMSAIKKSLATPENLSSVINWISGGGGGKSGVSEWDNAWSALGGNDDFIDYGEFI